MKKHPQEGKVYTAEEIQELSLMDTPFLQFYYRKGGLVNIQDSHITQEQLLSVPGFKETKWRYVRTTSEWFPIFRAVDGFEPEKYLDIYLSKYEDNRYVSTPKGFPREEL